MDINHCFENQESTPHKNGRELNEHSTDRKILLIWKKFTYIGVVKQQLWRRYSVAEFEQFAIVSQYTI
jgi:hypothetical protein